MLKESLGMLEVKGLVAAITVGDTMAKAANVHVRQKTLAKGHGWTTILVTGDVGAVNAALSAGRSVAVERGWIVSSKVIARPASMLELALEPDVNDKKTPAPAPAPLNNIEVKVKEEIKDEVKEEVKTETVEEAPKEEVKEAKPAAKKNVKGKKTNPKKK